MTQKPTKSAIASAGSGVLRAIGDLLLLLLMLGAAGGAGYWYGTIQRMAPVQMVGPGTPGAKNDSPNAVQSKSLESKSDVATDEQGDDSISVTPVPSENKRHGKKVWIASTGSDYIGYTIAVTVNDQPVDNFFAPGKAVDITGLLKKGDNAITFNAHELEEKFNAHKGDASKKLVLNVVTGPAISELYKPADVVLSYQRNASQTENDTQSFNFKKNM